MHKLLRWYLSWEELFHLALSVLNDLRKINSLKIKKNQTQHNLCTPGDSFKAIRTHLSHFFILFFFAPLSLHVSRRSLGSRSWSFRKNAQVMENTKHYNFASDGLAAPDAA